MAFTFRNTNRYVMLIFVTNMLAILGFIGSGIAIVRAFGIFCLTIVPINFLYIIFYFPCWLVLHENYIKKPFDCLWDCCFKCDFSCFKCKCECNCLK